MSRLAGALTVHVAAASTIWRTVELPAAAGAPTSLSSLADRAASNLRDAGQRVACVEATTGGLIQASLLATAGASKITTCGAIAYTSSRAVPVLGPDAQPLEEPLDASGHRCKPTCGAEYIASKQERVADVARRRRIETGAQWCICENGATGPTFNYDDLDAGFTAIYVAGPAGVERGLLIKSTHAHREDNMWGFSRLALEFLADVVAEARADAAASPPTAPVMSAVEDRYGGVEVSVRPDAVHELTAFTSELKAAHSEWVAKAKRGVWLKLPAACHSLVTVAVSYGFAFHHATPEYVQLTKWLPADEPSPLPRYAFTQIGVGGVIVSDSRKVLLVQERVSPSPRMQGSWKCVPAPKQHAPERKRGGDLVRCAHGRVASRCATGCRAAWRTRARTLRPPSRARWRRRLASPPSSRGW